MSDVVTANLCGLEQLKRVFAAATKRVGANVVKRGLEAAAEIGVSALSAEARKHFSADHLRYSRGGELTQPLFATAASRVASYQGGSVRADFVGFAWPAGAEGWLVEYGHRMVTGGTAHRLGGGTAGAASTLARRGKGIIGGRVPPHPIARPAFESVVSQMEAAFTSEVASRAETVLKRLDSGS